jgi:glycosyltransferase involved in cell wall biosynthesis
MEYRPYYLAREWVRSGHRVRIVAATYSHVRTRQPQPPAAAGTAWDERIDGIEYRWLRTPAYRGNGVGRLRNIATFLARLRLGAHELAREFRPDAVIASSTYPMDIWVARTLARLANAKLVFEVHDLWPLSPIELGGMSPRHPFIRVCQAAEDAAYRHADLVVSMLPVMTDYTRQKGLDPSRLVVVPNGVSTDEWQRPSPPALDEAVRSLIDHAQSRGEFIVVYAGSHGVPNALDPLLDAARLLRNARVRFVLVGDGHERARLQRRVREEGLDPVVAMFAPIAKAQIPALLARADAAYLGAPRVSIYRFGVSPNKMIDYMMAGVPIICAIEAGNDPIAEAGCGLTIPAMDAEALASAIQRLQSMNSEQRRRLGENGRRYALEHHTYPVLAQQFSDALQSLGPRPWHQLRPS